MLNRLRMWYWRKKTTIKTKWDTRGWKPGTVYVDCGYVQLTLVSITWDGDLIGVGEDGLKRMCSFYHCGPTKVE